MRDGPKLVFRPTGTLENPADNKVEVFLASPAGEVRLEISAAGALSETSNREKYLLTVIDLAIAQLLEARAREDDARVPT